MKRLEFRKGKGKFPLCFPQVHLREKREEKGVAMERTTHLGYFFFNPYLAMHLPDPRLQEMFKGRIRPQLTKGDMKRHLNGLFSAQNQGE